MSVVRGGKLAAVLIAVSVVAVLALVALWLARRELKRARRPQAVPRAAEQEGWVFGPRPKASMDEAGAQVPPPAGAGPPAETGGRRREDVALVVSPDREPEPSGSGQEPETASEERSPSDAALIDLLDDARPTVRRNAVAALATGGGRKALRGLAYAATRDPSVEVRRAAILGLRSMVGERSASSEGRGRTQGAAGQTSV